MFENLELTAKGLELLADIISGEEIEFTKIQLGDGSTKPVDISNLTSLSNVIFDKDIVRYEKIDDNTVKIGCNLLGNEITQEFAWTEIGIIAKNKTKGTDEVLFSYVYADNSILLPKGGAVVEMILDFFVKVDNADNVTITLNESALIPTIEQVGDIINNYVNDNHLTNETTVNNIVKDYVNDNSIVTDGNIILKIQNTKPTPQAGKTIIWFNTDDF